MTAVSIVHTEQFLVHQYKRINLAGILPVANEFAILKKPSRRNSERPDGFGGEYRSRTDDLFTASEAL
jgi:hypothetical protein